MQQSAQSSSILASLAASLALSSMATAQAAPTGSQLGVSYVVEGDSTRIVMQVSGADAPGFLIFAQLESEFAFHEAVKLGGAPVDIAGNGEFVMQIPQGLTLPKNTPIYFWAVHLQAGQGVVTGGSPLSLVTSPSEALTFNDLPDGPEKPVHGEILSDQWASIGLIDISADNKLSGKADIAALFNSNPPPNSIDPDLVTPGPGPNNDTAFHNLVVIAENDVDVDNDGILDSPDDEAFGGVLSFRFAEPVQLCEVTIIDLDEGGCQLRLYDGATLVSQIMVSSLGDNSKSVIGLPAVAADLFEIHLFGSGAIAQLDLVPCPARIDFDETSTGGELDHAPGLKFDDENSGLGILVHAASAAVSGTDTAVVFDSGNPTGGDTDLVSPGYGLNNDSPLGRVLVIAENVTDSGNDGVVDDPDDDAMGGRLVFNFDYDVRFVSGTVLDVDLSEAAAFEVFDGGGLLLGSYPLSSLGDNSVETVTANDAIGGVRRIDLVMSGSGALAELRFCPDPN